MEQIEQMQNREETKNEPLSMDQTMKTQNSDNSENKGLIKIGVNLKPLDPIPEIEWWDAFFLPENVDNPPKKFSTDSI